MGVYFDSASRADHGFLLLGKKYTLLRVPGATAEVPTSINNKGSVVLYWADSNGNSESSLFNGKNYKELMSLAPRNRKRKASTTKAT